jgi:hypothetical protein
LVSGLLVHCFIPVLTGAEFIKTEYQGRPHWMVRTPAATWFFDIRAGGISRLIDTDGRDWINFGSNPLSEYPASAAAGYRGMPNLVFTGPDKGAGHPGFGRCHSDISDGNTIRSESDSGKWAWAWTFHDDHAVFTMEKSDPMHPWWFLYEGPIAGRFMPSEQFWGTNHSGPAHSIPDNRSQLFDYWEWVYFGDRQTRRVLYLWHDRQEPDGLEDTLWYLGAGSGGAAAESSDGMMVFGFGRRPGTKPLFKSSGETFVVGFVEASQGRAAEVVSSRIDSLKNGKTPIELPDREIVFWHDDGLEFGASGEPQRWINIPGHVRPFGSVSRLEFRVNETEEWRPLSIGTDLHRLARPGDFNIELSWDEVRVGKNTVHVRAHWNDGSRSASAVSFAVTRGRQWPMPWSVDFSKVENIHQVVQVVDGRWKLTGDGIRTEEPWYDRVLTMGDNSWRNYRVNAEITIHGYTPPQRSAPTYNVSHFGIALRWRGHTADGRQPSRQWYPLGAQGELLLKNDPDDSLWRVVRHGGGTYPPVHARTSAPVQLATRLHAVAEVFTNADGDSVYRFKHWLKGHPEPMEWMVEAVEDGEHDQESGALCLVPHNSDVTIHSVRVEPLVAAPKAGLQARPGPGEIHYSALIGGVSGSRGAPFRREVFFPGDQLKQIVVFHQPGALRCIESIVFVVQKPDGTLSRVTIGGNSQGVPVSVCVPDGAMLTGLSGASGWFLDSIRFHFDDGSASELIGGSGGDTSFHLELNAASPGRIRGFHGTAAEAIETIGIIFDPAH